MYWLFVALYALHVIAAIVWFGGGLTGVLITGPALQRAGAGARADVSAQIGVFAKKVYPVAGTATILIGATLAVLGGRVTTLDGLETPYGITVLAALALAIGVWYWGGFVTGRSMQRVTAAPPAQRPALLAKALRNVAYEQVGFFAVFGCMVLMRFGL